MNDPWAIGNLQNTINALLRDRLQISLLLLSEFKGTVLQIEKELINDRLLVSKIS